MTIRIITSEDVIANDARRDDVERIQRIVRDFGGAEITPRAAEDAWLNSASGRADTVYKRWWRDLPESDATVFHDIRLFIGL